MKRAISAAVALALLGLLALWVWQEEPEVDAMAVVEASPEAVRPQEPEIGGPGSIPTPRAAGEEDRAAREERRVYPQTRPVPTWIQEHTKLFRSTYPEAMFIICDVQAWCGECEDAVPVLLDKPVLDPARQLLSAGNIQEGFFVAHAPPEDGEGVIWVIDQGELRIAWPAGRAGSWVRCEVLGEEGVATGVAGHVEGDLSWADDAWIHGCGGKSGIEEDGSYFVTASASGEECEIFVVAKRGEEFVYGEKERVTPKKGEDLEVDLKAPAAP